MVSIFFQRKQKEVQKENEFYVNLIQQALPTELQNQYIEKQKGTYIVSGYFVAYVRLLQTGNFQTCKDLKDQFNVTYALCIEMMGHKHRALYQSDV